MPRDAPMIKRIVREMMATGEDIQRVTERGVFVRSARKDCTFDCDFLELCQAQLQGADTDYLVKLKYQTSKRPDEEDMKKFWPSQNQAVKHGRS